MKFFYQYDENSPRIEITLSVDSTLDEVVTQFEGFLLAAGYRFNGSIIFSDQEPENVTA